MGSDLITLERQLQPLVPHFSQALAGVMPVERLVRTAIVAVERNPYLLECDRQSFFNTIMSAGVLGLEMDGVTGQCFPIPFKRKVQLVIGYKGYNTIAARAGLTVTGEVVREGDDFDYSLGTGAFVRHKPKLGNQGRIIGAWAQAAASNRPPVISILGIDELMEVKRKSPGAERQDSPWNNPAIGFPAMCSKTAKRRLCRSTPLNVMQLAARMEEAFEEEGRHSFIGANRELMIEGVASPLSPMVDTPAPTAAELIAPVRNRAAGDDTRLLADLILRAEVAAKGGVREYQAFFEGIARAERTALLPDHPRLKKQAEESDKAFT